MIDIIIREVITKYSYHLSDECIEALAERLEAYVDNAEDKAFWSGRDSVELY